MIADVASQIIGKFADCLRDQLAGPQLAGDQPAGAQPAGDGAAGAGHARRVRLLEVRRKHWLAKA